jgi:hypothetical protein
MNSGKFSNWSRRELARNTLLGGAACMFGTTLLQAEESSGGKGFTDVRQFGAKGDAKNDDTKAIQKAIDAVAPDQGAVFLPPGVYLCSEIQMRPDTALVGIPAWNYRGPGGTVLRLIDGNPKCLVNLTGAWGATVEGLALDGGNLGENVHGIFLNKGSYGDREDAFRLERCQVIRFSGDGVNLTRAWCFSIRHSMLAFNQGDGLNLRGWDGFLLDNWFSGNRKAGFGAREENASVTLTGNRIEWNGQENIVIAGGDGYQITGNFLDRAGTCGLALRNRNEPCSQITITGNFFKRSGKLANAEGHDSSQILMDGARGVTCVGNNLQAGRDDGGGGVWSPAYGIVYKGLENCVLSNNVLHEGALRQLILDLGGHGEGVIVRDNPGRLLKSSR